MGTMLGSTARAESEDRYDVHVGMLAGRTTMTWVYETTTCRNYIRNRRRPKGHSVVGYPVWPVYSVQYYKGSTRLHNG